MQEHAIMELIKWFTSILIILGMVSLAIFFFQAQELNTFRQMVTLQIERQGGLTEEAMVELQAFSDDNFNGRFTVESEMMHQRVSFGDIVTYTVVGTIPITIFPFPDVVITGAGIGVSQVR